MGIPYSHEINAAFDQVTPLVAAGFKVLKTTRNISILLAIIQVLTVVFLALILVVLLGVLYSVNPDLEYERENIVTPIFRSLAHLSPLKILKSLVASLIGFGGFVGVAFFLVKGMRKSDVEDAGNRDADKALEDLNGGGKKEENEGDKEGEVTEGKSGKEKADEERSEADKLAE